MKLIAALLAAIVAAITLAVPANADQIDYVMVLDDEGVYHDSITDVIDVGKMTCRKLRGGAGVPATLKYVASNGYAPYEIGVIVESAAHNMCPDVLPVLDSFFDNQQR